MRTSSLPLARHKAALLFDGSKSKSDDILCGGVLAPVQLAYPVWNTQNFQK